MKKLLLVLALLALCVPADALLAQTEISARGASIRIGGRLHAQFQSSSVEDTEADFFFRRARLIADVSVTDFWSGRVQADFAGGGASLQDAYVRMNFADNFRVSMGQFKRAFDLFELASSTELSIIERDGRVAGVSTCAGVGRVCSYGRFISSLALGGRDQGVRVETGIGPVSVLASVTNGTGANASDENDQKSLSGRVTFQATDDIALSAQFARHDFVNGLEDEYANGWGLDAEYGGFREGLHVQAAVAGGDNWRILDAEGDPSTFLAWQAVGAYYLPLASERFTAWEPLFRISSGDPNTDVDDDAGLVFTPGAMLYIQGRNKIGFNVDFWSPETGDSEWSLKVQSFLYF
jgi:hypothetical protein